MATRFFLDFLRTRVMPKICGRRACPPQWHIARNHVQHYLIHYILHGSGTFWKDGREYRLHSGDMFIMCPGQSAVYESDSSDPWEYLWIGFDGAGAFETLLAQDFVHIPAAANLFIQMTSSENEPGREWKVTGLIYQLLALMEQQVNVRPKKSYVDLTIDYIEKHYQENFQVGTLSDRLGLDRSYFCRLFKNQTGMSPQDYVVHYRLRQAEKLLSSTELPQKEIAKAVGYPDIYAFSRMFKRKYGIAPGLYRSSHHTEKPRQLEE